MRRERREEARCGNERGRRTEENHGGKQNYRQRETEGRTLKKLKGQRGAWNVKTKTQQDMIHRHKFRDMTVMVS